jgi:hypothetical protein
MLQKCAILLMVGACSSGSGSNGPATAPRPAPAVFLLEISVQPDSAVKLAKFALGAIDGTLQLPQIRSARTSLSTHYSRPRRGGGQTDVAVIAVINRSVHDTLAPVTAIEVGAWALDMAQQQSSSQRRSGFPATALSTNAPALRRPRAITVADTIDFRTLEYVIEAFEAHGARRRP